MTGDFTKGLQKGNRTGGGHGGELGAWKKKSHALMGTFSLMILGLILTLAWESAESGAFSLVNDHRETPKIVDFRLGDAIETEALLASSEVLNGSGRKLETDASVRLKVTDDEKIGLKSSLDGVKVLNASSIGDGEPIQAGSALPTLDPITDKTTSKTKADPSKPRRSKKSKNTSRDALMAGHEPSETIESDLVSSSQSEVCDLAKGHWVKDEKRHLYSGKECKQYLSSGFACRLMTRPDFDYEKLRWQPDGCDLPSFTGNAFLQRLRNKVVAFVGDSLGRQQFQSLMCMITEGKDDKTVEDVNLEWYGETKWAYLFPETNTTILFHWSVSLCEIEGGNPLEEPGYSAMHLDRPASFLQKFFDKIDVLILNTGHHWNRGKLQTNKWNRYVNGKPLVGQHLAGIGHSLNFTVHSVVKWLDEKLADSKRKPAVFFRSMSPKHFKNGDWDSGGKCDSSSHSQYGLPITTSSDKAVQPERVPVYKGPITDRIAEIAVSGTRVNLLNVTHLSQFREESHISKYGLGRDSLHQDCLHWCLPGVPDVWNELLYATLMNEPSLSPTSMNQR